MSDNIRIVPNSGRSLLGEGPLWSARRNAVFWVDILGCLLRRLDLASGEVTQWTFDEPIGFAVERADRDDFIVGLRSGFHALSLGPFELTLIGNPETDRPFNRLNDAKVDAAGRLWAGSKDDRDEGAQPVGALYRLDPDLRWSLQDDGYQVTNGPTFSVDERTLYHGDTINRVVYAFDLASDGTLSNKRSFARFNDTMGYPDGMTTDAEGGVWIAHWGGGRISRFLSSGAFDRAIALPTPLITSCAFAGDNLDRLFVTSAIGDTTGDPLAGALFEVNAGVTGVPTVSFAG